MKRFLMLGLRMGWGEFSVFLPLTIQWDFFKSVLEFAWLIELS